MVVETVSAAFERGSQSRHAAHFLGYGNGFGVDFVNQCVGQRQVTDGIVVLMPVEIIPIVAERLAQPVAVIEHRRDTVETETVEMVLVQPEFAVGQQEVYDFVLAVIEAQTVPRRVFAPSARIEILAGVTGKVAQAFHFVLHGVGVHDVHNHGNAHFMCLVDESFQFLRRTETAGSCKETRYMIAETSVVRMFLYGHDLYAVVPIGSDAGQHVFTEFIVRPDFLCILRHTDVAFINQQGSRIGAESLLFPHVRLFGRPDLRTEDFGLFVLYHAAAPCRNTFAASAVPMYFQLVEVAVFEGVAAQFDFPVPGVLYPFQLVFRRFLPIIEIAYQIDFGGMGRPFAEHPPRSRAVQAEI